MKKNIIPNIINILHFFLLLFLFNIKLVFAEDNVPHAAKSGSVNAIKIATGSILTPYYSIGLKLCAFISASNDNVKCEVVSTSGSVENLKLLNGRKVDIAITQSNIAMNVFNGDGYCSKDQPHLELRQLLTLHDEIFTIIAKDEDKINIFSDIAGKKITTGANDSASNITYEALKTNYNMINCPIKVTISPEEYAQKLCNGEIDAILLMVGHSNSLVNYITNTCDVEFVSIEKEELTNFLNNNKTFKKVKLLDNFYPGINCEQETIGVSAIAITNSSMDSNIIKNFIEYFKLHTKQFKESNYILENLPDEHFLDNFVLPMHEQLMIFQ